MAGILAGINSAVSAASAVKGLFGGSGPSPRALAAQANDFTREMMQNRHQWEVGDLRKAGLNPMLSSGAAPSMGSSAKAEFVNPVDNQTKLSHASSAAALARAQVENLKQDTVLKGAQAGSAEAATALANINSAQTAQNIAISRPKADISRLIAQGTGKFSSLANSAAGAARQVPRFITHGLPNLARQRAFSK